jgi:polysaccharide pyruvyl transferase WcaK-like protein
LEKIEYKNSLFVLAGNGPYDNRGCEAIVRGTVEILRQHFDKPKFVLISNCRSNSQFKQQKAEETDKDIIHIKTIGAQRRYEPAWFVQTGLRFIYPRLRPYIIYREILPYLERTKAVLSIGGDNYSLDYGKPKLFTDIDDLVLEKKKPIIIWGASVGPFKKLPVYEKYIIEHLKTVTGIFARETATVEYLTSRGVVSNVFRVADPAFLMTPTDPHNIRIEEDAIGINLSPLMAHYVTGGDLKKWTLIAADIVSKILKRTKRKIYLIPHVTSSHSNDYEFMRNVESLIWGKRGDVVLIPGTLSAAEIKGVISKLSVFAGARTHSNIAALSSGVPTLTFSYSIKATGINKDIFGDEQYCLKPKELQADLVAERIENLFPSGNMIREHLRTTIPRMKELAMDAGKYLKKIIEHRA